ncbi:MAG: NUDIX domain-containing protein [candidate division SR1 bacterium]|nr:NUDIX domain-containing protein [candidate division SR1 bacterium]
MKLIKEEIVFQGKIIEVVQQTVKIGDKELLREIAKRSPGVRLIITDGDKILLTKEFRTEVNADDYRLPGGKVFDTLKEYNEHRDDMEKYALIGVKRECEEETGLIPQNISLYHVSKVGATVERDLYYYVITKFTAHEPGQQLETGEYISVEWKTRGEVMEIIKQGGMQEDRSVGVLMRYLIGNIS